MGYVTSGYASRLHKRVRKQPKKLYFERKLGKKEGSGRSGRSGIIQEEAPIRVVKPQLGLQNLPQDVLERIFVFAGLNNGMPLLNHFFYRCLRPTRFLVGRYLMENLTRDLNELVRVKHPTCPAVLALSDAVFQNSMFLRFLNENHEFLDNVHDVIIPFEVCDRITRERRELYEDGQLGDMGVIELPVERDPLSDKPVQDFPPIFYAHPALFFQNDISVRPVIYNQLILRLHATYSIQQTSWVCDLLMQWFFLENDQFDINHLFWAVNLVLHLSVHKNAHLEDIVPLAKLIHFLYLDAPARIPRLLLCEQVEDSEQIRRRKLKIIDKFIRKFYRNSLELLSQDYLWTAIHESKDHQLAETIRLHGGKPSFNIIK